jgi:folate-binding protein YgfZ
MNEIDFQYRCLTVESGYVALVNRTLISITGKDRHQLLHSFCTADIKALGPGQGTEAFVLNDKGKILGYVLVLALEDRLLLSGAGDQTNTLIEHLDKYVIREDVQFADQSHSLDSVFVCGEQSKERLQQIYPDLPVRNQVVSVEISGVETLIAQVEIAGFGYLIVCETGRFKTLATELAAAGVVACDESALEIVRVENRTPWYGLDVDDRNLPQELQRDQLAISFTKGCYLGQETVARIDAIGHVNQWLVGLRFSGEAGSVVCGELTFQSKAVGRVTSAVRMPVGDWIGLGYVRRALAKTGVDLECEAGKATVC